MDKFNLLMGLVRSAVRVGTPEWDLFVLLRSDGAPANLRLALAEKVVAGGPTFTSGPVGKLLWETMPEDPWGKTASPDAKAYWEWVRKSSPKLYSEGVRYGKLHA